VAIVAQQASAIREHTNLGVGEYHGNKNVDMWTSHKWRAELAAHQVFVLTAQVLVDMLNHGFLALRQTNLLVFDECHHVMGAQHPYAAIMRKCVPPEHGVTLYRYEETTASERPRVLGLTASLIKTDVPVDKLRAQVRRRSSTHHTTRRWSRSRRAWTRRS